MTTLRSAPLRTRRRFRRVLALGDAIGPVGEHLQGALPAEGAELAVHVRTVMARGNPSRPGRHGGIEPPKARRNLARRLVAELMARHAAVGLQLLEELSLALSIRGSLLLQRKLGLVRQLHQREPVIGGIVFRRRRARPAPRPRSGSACLPGAACTFGESTSP